MEKRVKKTPVTYTCKAAIEEYTCKGASLRHKGIDAPRLQRMCLKGLWLEKKYCGRDRVPQKDAKEALFGRKVGRDWVIPVGELDRVFGG